MSPIATAIRRTRRRPASGFPLPAAGHVDLWCAALDDQPAEFLPLVQTFVSADEAERARRFYFERDRRRFLVGRGVLRMLLGAYLEASPREIAFRYGPQGKPALLAPESTLQFNVAHSEGLAVFAFTGAGELGIDIERIRDLPEWEQIAQTYFGPRDVARLYTCPPAQRREEFFRAWTRQEAALKAVGAGLGGAVIRPSREDRYEPERAAAVGASAGAFAVHSLELAPGFAAALAADRTVRRATVYQWTGVGAGRDRRVRRLSLSLPPEATGSK